MCGGACAEKRWEKQNPARCVSTSHSSSHILSVVPRHSHSFRSRVPHFQPGCNFSTRLYTGSWPPSRADSCIKHSYYQSRAPTNRTQHFTPAPIHKPTLNTHGTHPHQPSHTSTHTLRNTRPRLHTPDLRPLPFASHIVPHPSDPNPLPRPHTRPQAPTVPIT